MNVYREILLADAGIYDNLRTATRPMLRREVMCDNALSQVERRRLRCDDLCQKSGRPYQDTVTATTA